MLGARARSVDVKFNYNMYPKSIFGLLVKEDSQIKTPEDLRGTVVGVGTADGAEVSFTRAILSDLGMKEDEDYTTLGAYAVDIPEREYFHVESFISFIYLAFMTKMDEKSGQK